MRKKRLTTEVRQLRITHALAASAMALAFSASAQAKANQTFVSNTGSDTNVSVDCSASANCRTIAAALTVTNPGGELTVVNSGEYGAATITQPVVITAIGIDASIRATSGNALTIGTTGSVTITGLHLHGDGGAGYDGIYVSQVGFLRLYDMNVENFAANGVEFAASGGNLAVYGSKFTDCGHDGLVLDAPGSRAYVHGTEFDNNANAGADTARGHITIADSSAHYNGTGFYANGGNMELYGARAIYNVYGLVATGGALYLADCLIADNAYSYVIVSPGTISGSSPGTTLISPGQLSFGTLGSQALY